MLLSVVNNITWVSSQVEENIPQSQKVLCKCETQQSGCCSKKDKQYSKDHYTSLALQISIGLRFSRRTHLLQKEHQRQRRRGRIQEVEHEREGIKTDQVYEQSKEYHYQKHLSCQLCQWSTKLNQRRKRYDSSSVKPQFDHEILLLELEEVWGARRFHSGEPCSGREDGAPKA